MKKIFLGGLMCLCVSAFSQERIETDRPDQTECASVVKPGSVQLETGFLYLEDELNDQPGKTKVRSYNYATTLVRIGIFQRAELRMELGQYERTVFLNGNGHSSLEGFSPFVIGTKIAVCEEKGWIPETAFIGSMQLPLGDEKLFSKDEVLPAFCFSMAHTLSEKLSLGYNLGMEWNSSMLPSYYYTLTIGAEAGKKGEVFIETFGSCAKGVLPESHFDIGAAFLPFNNLKFDISGGVALNENSTDLFLSAGFSVRLPD